MQDGSLYIPMAQTAHTVYPIRRRISPWGLDYYEKSTLWDGCRWLVPTKTTIFMWPTWGPPESRLSAPGRSHVGPMNLTMFRRVTDNNHADLNHAVLPRNVMHNIYIGGPDFCKARIRNYRYHRPNAFLFPRAYQQNLPKSASPLGYK